jgi:1-acyl-sn-glycerol-3-phosphate acyltransferase
MIRVLSRTCRALGYFFYGLYAWIVFLLGTLFSILCAIFLPGLERRWRWVSRAARAIFALAGIPATVTGLEHLPAKPCIVVANHASYLDGVILQAFLPPRFSFVIKGEVRKVPVLHFILRRVGAKFVERFVAAGSARDARTLVKAAASGESMVIFPEGTFIATPGLGRFRPGAFAAALKGQLPIVPVAIRGSRQILPAKTIWPAPGSLQVDIRPPIDPSDSTRENGTEIAELARQRILEVLDEPDLLLADSAVQRQ